jgi:hypothetical protein
VEEAADVETPELLGGMWEEDDMELLRKDGMV